VENGAGAGERLLIAIRRLGGCGKTHRVARSSPRALKRASSMTYGTSELVPFPFLQNV